MFVFRRQLTRFLDTLLKVLFVLLLLAAISAVFLPSVYEDLTDRGLKATGTYDLIVEVDDGISQIQDIPQNLFDGLQSLFGGEQPLEDQTSNTLLEDTLYVGLVSTISGLIRLIVIAVTLLGLILLTYIQYSIGGAADVHKLERRVRELEDRLADMQLEELETSTYK